MKIWSIVFDDSYHVGYSPDLFFSSQEAEADALRWVTIIWGEWFGSSVVEMPRDWREAYAHLCEQTGFVDIIVLTAHDISAHPAAAQARGALNNCVDQLNLLADLAKCEDDDVQNARLDVEIALEMLNK